MTRGLASGVMASALVRLAQARGGFAAILAKGDADGGQLLIVILEKGQFSGLFERQIGPNDAHEWRSCGPQAVDKPDEIADYCNRRRARDPDLWIIELDVPDATQLVAQLGEIG